MSIAHHAKELLDSEAWAKAYAAVESSLAASWSVETEWRKREALWERLQALKDLKAQLESFVADGTLRK